MLAIWLQTIAFLSFGMLQFSNVIVSNCPLVWFFFSLFATHWMLFCCEPAVGKLDTFFFSFTSGVPSSSYFDVQISSFSHFLQILGVFLVFVSSRMTKDDNCNCPVIVLCNFLCERWNCVWSVQNAVCVLDRFICFIWSCATGNGIQG